MEFKVTVDLNEVAEKLRTTKDLIENRILEGVKTISAATHAFIVEKAKKELSGYKLNAFLGIGDQGKTAAKQSDSHPMVDTTAKHLRWIEVTRGLWIVELDERANFIEDGRESTFMGDWLLKPGAKGVKKAKDGSYYRPIPFVYSRYSQRGASPGTGNVQAVSALTTILERTISKAKIPKSGILGYKVNPDGTQKLNSAGRPILGKMTANNGIKPIIGLVKDLGIGELGFNAEGATSKPRTAEEAALTGLKPHSGIFYLQGAAIYQRKDDKGKLTRETVVFRTISSKHKLEGRWMYPEIKPFGAMKAAHEFANDAVQKMIKEVSEEFQRQG